MIQKYDEVILIEEKNEEYHTDHTPEEVDKPSLPIVDEGELNSLVVIADDKEFKLTVRVDDNHVVDDTFEDLTRYSNDLPNVSAYERGSSAVIVVTEYPFVDRFSCHITPEKRINFEKIRVEVLV